MPECFILLENNNSKDIKHNKKAISGLDQQRTLHELIVTKRGYLIHRKLYLEIYICLHY